jgi:hypothetical protein
VAALAAVALGPSGAQAVPGTASKELVTFGIGPSDGTKPDGRPYFYYTAAPGASLVDHAVVLNYSTKPLQLSVYATDGLNSPDGATSLLTADQQPHDLGAWTRLSVPQRLVTVPGRRTELDPPGKLEIPFRVTVPRDAAPGDHVGGLVVSLRTQGRNAQGFVIPLDQRVATQVFLRVAGALRPQLRVEDLRATYLGTWNPFGTGRFRLSYTVHNVGNVRLGAAQRVSVSGFFGSWASPHLKDLPLLVPGGKAHVETEVRGVWPEIWMPGTVRIRALKLQTDVNPATTAAGASQHFWAIPWTLLLMIAAALLYRRVRRWLRRRPDPAGEGPGEDGPPEPPAEPTPPPVVAQLVPVGASEPAAEPDPPIWQALVSTHTPPGLGTDPQETQQ